jgi:release factor glutamine methyltransferase
MLKISMSQKLKSCLASLREKYQLTLKESHELAAHVIQAPVQEIPFVLDTETSETEFNQIEACFKRVANHEPLAYVLGYVDFYGVRLSVNSHVLIPRYETELLVEKILNKYPQESIVNVLDLCAGSGCIGLALKKQRPNWNVVLVELSKEALAVAANNAQLNNLEVHLLQGDLFRPVEDSKSFFDLIVSNPPYISEKEYLSLEYSVRAHEPKLALTPGVSGCEIYSKIAERAFEFLSPGGKIALEIGYNQKEEVTQLFTNSFYKNIICEKDLASHNRFIFLELQ